MTGVPECNQVSDELKDQVPDHIREKAREMAREELRRRLEELDMAAGDAAGYGALLDATQSHMVSLHDLLEREEKCVLFSGVMPRHNCFRLCA